jgi:hypothetical protein
MDRSHIDRTLDEGLHTNELQCDCLDPPRSTYKKMTSDDILERIINHEMSQLQRSKKLLSKLARRARTSK